MENNRYFIIDFDSTFTQVEALEELGEICLTNNPDKANILKSVKSITDSAMDGNISFTQSLEQRLALLKANKSHIPTLIQTLKGKVSESVIRNKEFFEKHTDQIRIISSGFKEFIEPVVADYGIQSENVYANTFEYNEKGEIIGFDKDNVLSWNKGKVELMKKLRLEGDIYVIGDGYTDYEIRQAGFANKFYAFTENVSREKVISNADHIAPNFDEVLYSIGGFPMAVSYPENRIKVLILENIHPEAQRIFSEEGYQIEVIPGALDEDELCKKIVDVSILCIRSKTMVTAKALDHAKKLIAVGAYCIGTNQIDLKTCTKKGIVVFNAPYSNTRSVVELAIGQMILLTRGIIQKSNQMHAGKWDKSAKNSYEIRGKKLGIIGYGNIGTQLSVVAEALGMEVYYYDTVEKLSLGNAKKCKTLEELFRIADVVTLHIDGRASNKNIIGEKEFEQMKKGVIFLNLARGHVVDIEAMANALKSGKIRGASVDVFPYEPKTNDEEFISPLRGFPNVILTPHIGGSTEEAQFNIAQFVPNKIISYINTGSTYGSVNLPEIQMSELKDAHRLIHIHENFPGIMAKINQSLAKYHINILGQYLKTNETTGYVITDIDTVHGKDLEEEMRHVDHTIRFRILY